MEQRFTYLLDRLTDAELVEDPFPHLYLTDFLSDDDFRDVVTAPQVELAPTTDIDGLFTALESSGYERIDFPGCLQSKEEYVQWLDERQVHPDTKPTCEAQGLAFRLADPAEPTLAALDTFFHSPELQALLVERFGLTRRLRMEGGIQKYLHGYEISPHPDIRKKALTWMLNVNPAPDSEQLDIHTHYMKLKPEWSYITEFWRHNQTAETCWLPWSWCTTVRQQVENNSLVAFSPRWDTIHAIRAHYDHLPTQRTQYYGNLWYEEVEPPTTISPDHDDLSIVSRESDRGRLEEAEHEVDELRGRLERLLSHPAVKVGQRARNLVRRGPN